MGWVWGEHGLSIEWVWVAMEWVRDGYGHGVSMKWIWVAMVWAWGGHGIGMLCTQHRGLVSSFSGQGSWHRAEEQRCTARGPVVPRPAQSTQPRGHTWSLKKGCLKPSTHTLGCCRVNLWPHRLSQSPFAAQLSSPLCPPRDAQFAHSSTSPRQGWAEGALCPPKRRTAGSYSHQTGDVRRGPRSQTWGAPGGLPMRFCDPDWHHPTAAWDEAHAAPLHSALTSRAAQGRRSLKALPFHY